MRSARTSIGVVLLFAGCTAGNGAGEIRDPVETPALSKPRVVLETGKGRIVLELEPERAPESVQNFLLHVRSRFYDGLTFHRVKPDFVIQAGLLTPDGQRRQTTVMGILNEADNGLKNVRGAVAMARTGDPHGATSEFFINVKDNPTLDFREKSHQGWGYAVFGRVVEGMNVVDAIAAVPTRRTGRYEALPVDPMVIRLAYVAPDTTT